MELKEIPVLSISPTAITETSIRKDPADILKLRASIEAHGLINPIVIAPLTHVEQRDTDDEYGIIDGHCRFAAFTDMYGSDTSIPSIILTENERQNSDIGKQSLMANIIRDNMSEDDVADAVHALYDYYIDEHGKGSYRGLAAETGLSKSKIGRLIANYNTRHATALDNDSPIKQSAVNPYTKVEYISYDKKENKLILHDAANNVDDDAITTGIAQLTSDVPENVDVNQLLDSIQQYRALLAQAESAVKKFLKK